jgi:flavin reductase (DIM6/NTAB) family NADH-FMN oxidoreductase RutF
MGEEPTHAQSVTATEFKNAFRNHPAGVALVTADAGDGPVALTATSVISVSASPPVLIFSVSAQSSATPTLRRASTAVVHLLGAAQLELARLGATSGLDRFADRSLWSRLETGEPYFHDVPARLLGRVRDQLHVGESTVIALEVLQIELAADAGAAQPLVYHDRTWHRLGAESAL